MATKNQQTLKPKRLKTNNNITTGVDYRNLFSNLPGLYLILTPDLSILEASKNYLVATYTNIDEIRGKNIFEVFPDDMSNAEATGVNNLRFSLNYVLKNKREHIMAPQRYDVLQPNGEFIRKYWQPLNRPIINSANEVELIIHTVEDITDLELSKEHYKKREDENLSLLKELSELKYAVDQYTVVDVTDHKGVLQYVNENYCKISKYSREELIGRTNQIVNSGYHPKAFFAEMWKTILMGKVWKSEIKNRAKDGSEYWVDTTIMPFINEFGKPYKYMAIRVDITDLKNNEADILKKSEELLQSNKELDSFSYSVSHDLRAPLRAINGYARILSEDYEDKLDEEAKRIINVITNNAKRMGVLIDDLLAFSKLGKQNLIKVDIDMDSLVNGITREYVNSYFDKKYEIDIKPLKSTIGDSNMLHQVLTNLIANALKYSSKCEKPKIEIGSYTENGNNVYYIKDNGAGFDMKYYDKLFGVFQRLHGPSEYEGTGVGLAIVNRVINKHGGTVWAEGKVNEGATFYFSLPNN